MLNYIFEQNSKKLIAGHLGIPANSASITKKGSCINRQTTEASQQPTNKICVEMVKWWALSNMWK